MNVYVSYSGELSRDIASVIKECFPMIIQSLNVFVSAQDVKIGSFWRSELERTMEESECAIICITKENNNSPWLIFEAGMMAKKTTLVPLLIDIGYQELNDPLAVFHATLLGKEGLYSIINLLNKKVSNKLDSAILSETFEVMWPMINDKISNILSQHSVTPIDSSLQAKEE